jgi:hypothetical protein
MADGEAQGGGTPGLLQQALRYAEEAARHADAAGGYCREAQALNRKLLDLLDRAVDRIAALERRVKCLETHGGLDR